MLCSDIIKHLIKYLPRLTDKFSNTLDVSNVSIAGDVVTITFSASNTLQTGNQITIHNALVNIDIDTLTYDDGIITATTLQDHDLTFGYQQTITIANSSNSSVNGKFNLTGVTNRRTFKYQYDLPSPTPTFGSPILVENIEDNHFNGIHSVVVINDTTVEITILNNPYTQINFENIVVSSSINISGGSNLERLIDAYESQKPIEPWLFVVLDDLVTGKARSSPQDSIQNASYLNAWNIEQLAGFSIYFFNPTVDQLTGRLSRDDAETLRSSLYSVMINSRFNTGLAGGTPMSNVTPTNDGIAGYTKSYYIHQYQWQQVQQVTGSDVGNFVTTRAFRDLNMKRLNPFDIEILDDNINLDEEPL